MFSEFAALCKPEIKINGADGREYILSPLGFKEIAEFCIWLQFKDYHQAKKNDLDKEALKEIYNQCKEHPVAFEDPIVLHEVMQPEGISKVFYYSLRIKHPELKEGDISKIINIDMYSEIQHLMAQTFGLVEAKKENSLGE